MIERAKGILMERHDIDEESAFGMLRDEARRTHRKVVDLAEAVIVGRPVLPTGRPQELVNTLKAVPATPPCICPSRV